MTAAGPGVFVRERQVNPGRIAIAYPPPRSDWRNDRALRAAVLREFSEAAHVAR